MKYRTVPLWQRLLVFHLCVIIFVGELAVIVRHLREGTSVVYPVLVALAMVCTAVWQVLSIFL
jgi:hypothetical protein